MVTGIRLGHEDVHFLSRYFCRSIGEHFSAAPLKRTMRAPRSIETTASCVVSISFRSQLSQAFEQATVAMTAVITEPAPVAAKEIVQPNLSFFWRDGSKIYKTVGVAEGERIVRRQ